VYNYKSIKEFLKKMRKTGNKVRVKDLLALAQKNDPFYLGSSHDLQVAKWIANIYKRMGSPKKCHIRRMHYWAAARENVKKPDGLPYKNTDRDWKYLMEASKKARYLGLIPMENVVDRRNPDPIIYAEHWKNRNPEKTLARIGAEAIADAMARSFNCFNPASVQAYHQEIWNEKSTVNDIVVPVCEHFGENYVYGLGEMSITAVKNLIHRVVSADKPVRIWYISDYDPAGENMPISVARKIEWFVRTHYPGLDIRLDRLVLTGEQCRKYELPRTPIKNTDLRKTGWEERHGEGATELDALEALHPGELARILTDAMTPYFDENAAQSVRDANERTQKAVKKAVMEHGDEVEMILRGLDPRFDNPQLLKAKLIPEANGWLYDSDRDYFEQLKHYKRAREPAAGG
jgi:hypothetical protein